MANFISGPIAEYFEANPNYKNIQEKMQKMLIEVHPVNHIKSMHH